MIAEIPILLSILTAIRGVLHSVWSFVKAKALLVWTFLFVVLPKILDLWIVRRAIGYAAIAFMFWAIYSAVSSCVSLFTSLSNLTFDISSILSQTSWAGWLVWDGPLHLAKLWDELLGCVSFWMSVHALMFLVTKVEYFQNQLFNGGLGPRR